jgi:hypothetical protein
MNEIHFCDGLTIAVPEDFKAGIQQAAERRGLNVADLVRLTLSDEMSRLGIEHPRLPALHRAAPLLRARRRP